MGQERITNPKEQDIRPAKERLRVAWEATPDAILNRTSKPFYFRSVSHLNLDNMTKFGKNRFEISHGKMGSRLTTKDSNWCLFVFLVEEIYFYGPKINLMLQFN